MSQGEHIKVFDPPLEEIYEDRGYYYHAIDDLNTDKEKLPQLAVSFVGYVIEHACIYEYPDIEPEDDQLYGEVPEEDEPKSKFEVIPLGQAVENAEVIYEHLRFRGITSVIRLMVYAAGEKLKDDYYFQIPGEEGGAENPAENPDQLESSMAEIENHREALVLIGTVILKQHLQRNNYIKEWPQAA